jgi:hypothetical protein
MKIVGKFSFVDFHWNSIDTLFDLEFVAGSGVEYLGIIGNIQIWQSLFGACLGEKLKQASVTF